MDVADHLWLSQGEEIAVVQQVLRRTLEALPADVSFRHPVGADRGAHRSIDDRNSTLHDLLKRMLLCFAHVSLNRLKRGPICNSGLAPAQSAADSRSYLGVNIPGHPFDQRPEAFFDRRMRRAAKFKQVRPRGSNAPGPNGVIFIGAFSLQLGHIRRHRTIP